MQMYIFIGVILLLIAIYLFLIAGAKPDLTNALWLKRRCFAHRGLFEKDQSIPENSLPAFQRAVDAGYGIELDVALTKDEQVVVFHDDTLKRMTEINKRIDEVTYNELRNIRLKETGNHAPLFEDVLELVAGKVPLIVELKNGKKNKLLCTKTYELLKGYKGDYCIESFNPFIVKWFKDNAPSVIRGQLSMNFKGEETLKPIEHFVLGNLLLNFLGRPNFIAYRHQDSNRLSFKLTRLMGLVMVAWTVESKKDMDKAIKVYDSIIFQHFIPGRTF